MSQATPLRLQRQADEGGPERPVRIVHLGLGNFFRAHQAWYTDRAPDAEEWGIAAFTGRRQELAAALLPQSGLYTLVTRAGSGDRFDVVRSVSAVHPATDHQRWLDYHRSDSLAIVTITVTEAGYLRSGDGSLDATDAQVRHDVAALRSNRAAPVSSVPARLLAGLVARKQAGLGPIAVMPCDNLPGNGSVVADVIRDLALLVDRGLVAVVDEMASFVTTMVDRITPETTDLDRETVQTHTGVYDAAPVTTEPFSEWVISGEFPAGRPAWEIAGATITDDVAPYEQRKLQLLNGAHSLLAYGASIRGHLTVAEAVSDPVCLSWLGEWWDEAATHLPLPADDLASYRSQLLERFGNPRIRHLLAQIAADGSQKLPVRILPVLRAERTAGRVPVGAARAVAAWVCHLRGLGAPVSDPQADVVRVLAQGTAEEAARKVLEFLDPQLGKDEAVVDAVVENVEVLSG